jgi:hypothetical protein
VVACRKSYQLFMLGDICGDVAFDGLYLSDGNYHAAIKTLILLKLLPITICVKFGT